MFRVLHPCVYLYIPTDSTGKPNLFLLAALFALSRIGGQKGSSNDIEAPIYIIGLIIRNDR